MLRMRTLVGVPCLGLMIVVFAGGADCVPPPNNPPVANAGPDLEMLLGDRAQLNGTSSSDVDGDPLSYRWQMVRGPASVVPDGAETATPSFVPPVEGVYEFALTVSDPYGSSDLDTMKVSASDCACEGSCAGFPTARARTDQDRVCEGSPATLDASRSEDFCGLALAYSWRQTGGTSVDLMDFNTANPSFTAPLVEQDLQVTFELTVSNGTFSDTDTVTVLIQDCGPPPPPPAASARALPGQTVNEGALVTLDGSGSSDPQSRELTYAWRQTAGPTVTLSDSTTVKPTFTAPAVDANATLTFELTVSNGTDFSIPARVDVSVRDVSVPPVDNCPDDPNKTQPGQCGCGVADTDTDGDTVMDCNDNCPDDPNTDQADSNGNGKGDVCDLDLCPGGGPCQVVKVLASDGGSGHKFGAGAAISGDTAVIGAPSYGQGAAYVFQRNLGGLSNWGEVTKLTPSNGVDSNFGYQKGIAISVDTIVIGASASGAGAAYVFERNQGGPDNWGEVARLTASDGQSGDVFGYGAAISGDTIVVTARGDDSNKGAAYIFEKGAGWLDGSANQTNKITASDGAAGDKFGQAMGLDTNTVVIGAFMHNSWLGAAYVFDRNQGGPNNWGQVAKLQGFDGVGNNDDEFGQAVAIYGDTALVGANHQDENGAQSGAAYVFERNHGGPDNWGQLAKLLPSDGDGMDIFGSSVSISSETILIGAENYGSFSGSVYVFYRDDNGTPGNPSDDSWVEEAKLLASDGVAGDFFGSEVALSGETAVIGTQGDDDKGAESGSAYVFQVGD